ncbi:MAG: choice-of-anchor B family protein [Actinobacteria bacterium]|nr:choice-of-anchor B family protein [Actinomycetota bacterium]
MWEERWHPLREEWVIVAAHRQNRPWIGETVEGGEQEIPAYVPDCYLCPGNPRVSGAQNPPYTSTYVFDVSNLTEATNIGVDRASTPAIDHNLYVRGQKVYQANYRAGLRILDLKRVASSDLREVGFFDVYPADDAAEFNGAWSNYPFYGSGTVVVSGIEQGLFVLRPR